MKTIFDYQSEQELNEIMRDIVEKIRSGIREKDIKRNLKKETADELFSIAIARIKGREKFKNPERMWMNEEDLRFATSEIIAKYRAERLKCRRMADLCCGIGAQTAEFAKTCKEVVGIEKDERKAEYAKRNVKEFRNAKIITGNALKEEIKCDSAFCDPSRAAEEKERSARTEPAAEELLRIYPDLAFEMPPQLRPEKIRFDCEKEYLSVDGKLNRLTLYFGKLKKDEISAVSLPSGERIAKKNIESKIKTTTKARKYIYEVDTAITQAGLLAELIDGEAMLLYYTDKKRTLLTADNIIGSAFLQRFEVVRKFEKDLSRIKKELRELGYGKLTIRAAVKPEDYWKLRSQLENEGEKKGTLFLLDEWLLAAKQQDL